MVSHNSDVCLNENWTPAVAQFGGPTRHHAVKSHKWNTSLRSLAPGQVSEAAVSCRHLSFWDYNVNNLAVRTDLTPDQFKEVSGHLDAGDAYKVSKYQPHMRAGLIEWIHAQGGHQLLRPLSGDERARALCLPRGCAKLTDQHLDAFSHADWVQIDAVGNVFPLTELVKECKIVIDRIYTGQPPGLGVNINVLSRDQLPSLPTTPNHGTSQRRGGTAGRPRRARWSTRR